MSNRKPLVNDAGRVSEVPDEDDLLLAAGALVKPSVDSGKTKTIPSGYQLLVHGGFDAVGTVDVAGDLVVL